MFLILLLATSIDSKGKRKKFRVMVDERIWEYIYLW